MAREAIGHRRRGASYVFFLGTATLVVIIGLSALTVLRVKSRAAEGGHDSVAAQLYAQSAVEQALLTIYTDGGWRGTISPDTWSAPQAIGQGEFRWKLVDDVNGSLTADRNAPLRVYGLGDCGESVWVYSAEVQPPLETVPANLLVNGDLEAGGVSPWASNGGCMLQLNTSSQHGGTASLLVTGRSAGSSASQSLPPPAAGATYRASVWVQNTAGTEIVWLGAWVQYDTGWEYLEFAREAVGSSWKQLSGTISPSESGAATSTVLVVGTDGTDEFNVDDARLIATPSVIGVIPGTWRRETQ